MTSSVFQGTSADPAWDDKWADAADFSPDAESVSERAVMRWVADNMGIRDAAPGKAPSPAAWFMLAWCRLDPKNEALFWQRYLSMPVKEETVDAELMRDDGRALRTCEEVMRLAAEVV